MQYFAWFWILALSFGMVAAAAKWPGVLWRGIWRGHLGQAACVSMFVVHLDSMDSQLIVFGTSMIVGVPTAIWSITHYSRYARRYRDQRLCADCGYLLPAEIFEGKPCPECGSECWVVMPSSQLEMFERSPSMPKYWIEMRVLVLVFLLCAALMGLGRELGNGIGREIEHTWLAAAVAVGVWIGSAGVAIAVTVSVRHAADTKRIERDRSKAA